jgi:hypothetical protein
MAETLRRQLKSRGIERSGSAGYTLAELVRSQLPDGQSAKERSLEAHALLLSHKAALTQLEIGEREGALIQREPALQFVKSMLQILAGEIYWHEGLSIEEQNRLVEALGKAATRLYVRNGWMLEPSFRFSRNGDEAPPRDRRELWAARVCNWLWQAQEQEDKKIEREERETAEPPEPEHLQRPGRQRRRAKPGRGRNLKKGRARD